MKKKWFTLFMACLLLFTGTACMVSGEGHLPQPDLFLTQFNIGCAAGYLVMVGNTVIIIDAGNDIDGQRDNRIILEYLEASGIDHIDAHIVTHYHADHAMNIPVFSEKYGNKDTILYGPSKTLPARFLPLPNGQYRQMKDNDEIWIGSLFIKCLGPASDEVDGEDNTDSLNFLMSYGDVDILFTGDYVSKTICKRHAEELKKVDVLCFPHHGLKPFAIERKTLEQIRAKVVLVPAWAAQLPRLYCQSTGMDAVVHGGGSGGTVVVQTNGIDLQVFTMVEPGQFRYASELVTPMGGSL